MCAGISTSSPGLGRLPIGGSALEDDIAVLGEVDGGRQYPVEAEAPVLTDQPFPGLDGARHGHRVRTRILDAWLALGQQLLGGERRGGARPEPL